MYMYVYLFAINIMENGWRLLYLKEECNKEKGLVSLSYECKKSVCIFKGIYVNLF